MSKSNGKLSVKEMLAYGCGDFASVLYWTTFMKYLTYFYTDVFLLAPAIAGALLGWSRSLDGVTDVAVGVWADRNESRWGKFRPFLIWGCTPFAIAGVLTFTTPGFIDSSMGKLIWAAVTYNALMIMYTVVNIPYTALMGVMTDNPVVRTRLSSYKFIFAFSAGVVISFALLPTVDFLGGKNDPQNMVDAIVAKGVSSELATSLVEADDASGIIKAIVPSEDPQTLLDSIVQSNIPQILINKLVPSGKPEDVVAALVEAGNTSEEAEAIIQTGIPKELLGSLLAGIDPETSLSKIVDMEDDRAVLNVLVPRGNPQLGWMLSFVIIGLAAIGFFLVTGFNTKERIHPKEDKSSSLFKDFGILITNKPWVILLCTTLTWILFVALRSSIAPHYFKYYIYDGSEDAVLTFLGQDFSFTYLMSTFNGLGQIASVLGVVAILFAADKFPKRLMFIGLLSMQIACTAAYMFLGPNQLGLIFGLEIIGNFVGAPLPVLMWAMYADTADHGEWKSGRRTTALVFSASTMSQKFGWGIAAYVALKLLDLSGFIANTEPSAEVKDSLVQLMSIIPSAFGVVAIVIFLFFSLNEKKMEEIRRDLNSRRGLEE
ncbi:sugar (Glycoside-Pentoside-Hexuronide) transporter subfamily [Verrucomicrobiia bacterium DG1235]|nr:sugar (Glycoside-Pentoside-Hexuronide) transporter subfamily [Verrucomicrobiae bacterium DG1235]